MEIINAHVPNKFTLDIFSDLHIGSVCYQEALAKHIVSEISRPGHFGLGNGDYVEGISVDDKRYTREDQGHSRVEPLLQHNYFIDLMKPISRRPNIKWEFDPATGLKKPERHEDGTIHVKPNASNKLIALGKGNHENYTKRAGDIIGQHTVPTIGVPYATYDSRINLIDSDGLNLKIFMWHGAGGGLMGSAAKDPEQASANVKSRLAKKLSTRWNDIHFAAMGHVHQTMAWRPRRHRAARVIGSHMEIDSPMENSPMDISKLQDNLPINEFHRWYAVTGTAKGWPPLGVSNWESEMNFGAPDLGYVRLHYNHGEFWVEPVHWDQMTNKVIK